MGNEPIRDILDFGCGCGRVTRFMRAEWPDAHLWVTDLRKDDEAWVVENLGCQPLPSPQPPKDSFDLIFLGSVFTHLPQGSARELLALLLGALRTGGVLVFSTQGRWPQHRLKHVDWEMARQHTWMVYGLSPTQVDALLKSSDESGYSYIDYDGQHGYGIAIAPAQWYFSAVIGMADVTQVMNWERGFDDHQDMLGFLKRPIGVDRSHTFIQAVEKALANR